EHSCELEQRCDRPTFLMETDGAPGDMTISGGVLGCLHGGVNGCGERSRDDREQGEAARASCGLPDGLRARSISAGATSVGGNCPHERCAHVARTLSLSVNS